MGSGFVSSKGVRSARYENAAVVWPFDWIDSGVSFHCTKVRVSTCPPDPQVQRKDRLWYKPLSEARPQRRPAAWRAIGTTRSRSFQIQRPDGVAQNAGAAAQSLLLACVQRQWN